jgi:Transposase DDE domain
VSYLRCQKLRRKRYASGRERRGVLKIQRYWSSACPKCPMKAQCTTSDYRRISRWEHEEVLEDVQRRLDQSPKSMSIRRRTIEHVFGTLKGWMGYTHFLTRRLPHVGAEMSLNILAYNFKRVLSILGYDAMMKAMRLVGACALLPSIYA